MDLDLITTCSEWRKREEKELERGRDRERVNDLVTVGSVRWEPRAGQRAPETSQASLIHYTLYPPPTSSQNILKGFRRPLKGGEHIWNWIKETGPLRATGKSWERKAGRSSKKANLVFTALEKRAVASKSSGCGYIYATEINNHEWPHTALTGH